MDGTIRTGVDELLEYLEDKDKVALLDAANDLKINPEIVQSWVDFLVDEGIIGIEYKFTKPFIYLNKSVEQKTKAGQQKLSYSAFKEEFLQKAKEKRIPDEQALVLWKSHMMEQLNSMKNFFFQQAKNKNVNDVDSLWDNYKTSVILKL